LSTGTNNNQTKSAADGTTVVVAVAAVVAAIAVAPATGTGMATTTGMATDTATVTAATTMTMLVTMVMMVMMAAAWKSSVAGAEVVVMGVAMAAAMHLADYLR
jgi:hypothetical protein